jgi:hypothetical protein
MDVICVMLVSLAMFEGSGLSYRDKCRQVGKEIHSAVR